MGVGKASRTEAQAGGLIVTVSSRVGYAVGARLVCPQRAFPGTMPRPLAPTGHQAARFRPASTGSARRDAERPDSRCGVA